MQKFRMFKSAMGENATSWKKKLKWGKGRNPRKIGNDNKLKLGRGYS